MYGTMFQAASEWQRAMFSGFRMMMSASTVIQVRMMQMSLGIMKPEETARMFLEKPATFAKSTEMSMRALAGNKGLAAAALAGIAPIGQKTAANARRLSGKGASTTKRRRRS
ncbi:hypothetical protein [Salipiger sp.]|uniref:hypothetical protein n=1 Tax=Salipiger sp. TaxID=2078585 RepID=UPI003A983665